MIVVETRIKDLRLRLSSFENSCSIPEIFSGNESIVGGAELTLAFRNLQRSKMWLGKVLEAIGEPTPYPQADNAASQKIESQAQKSPDKIKWEGSYTTIGRIKHLRVLINNLAEEIEEELFTVPVPEEKELNEAYFKKRGRLVSALTQALLTCQEARMWLGQVLHQIGEDQKVDKNAAISPAPKKPSA